MRSVLAVAAASAAWSQPPRAPEVWGNVGIARAAGDESSLGSGVIYGAGASLPFTRRFAFEADIARLHADRFVPFTRVLFSPAIVARWGKPNLYGFAGGGVGVQHDRGHTGGTVHARGGFVVQVAPKLVLRTEVFSAWHYVMPTIGGKFGFGYRF
jgi:hypothetical protein